MILKIFNDKYIIAQYSLILGLFILLLSQNIVLYEPHGFGPLYTLIFQTLKESSPLILSFVFGSLVLIEGLLLQIMGMYYNLIPRNNFLIPFVWLLLMFSNPVLASISPTIFALVIASYAFFKLVSISDKSYTLASLFTSGFFFSIASLIYGYMIWYILFLIIALLVLSLFKARETLVSIISFAIPYLYLVSYDFVFDNKLNLWPSFQFGIGNWTYPSNAVQLSISISLFILILAIAFISTSKLTIQLNSKLIHIRKITSLLFILLILNVILQFISDFWWFSNPINLFLPLTFIISIYISEQKKNYYLEAAILIILILEIIQLYYSHYA